MNKEQERAWKAAERAAQQLRKDLIDGTYDDVIALLLQAKSNIAAALANQPSDFQQWHLGLINIEIDRVLGVFQDKAGEMVSNAVGAAWEGGISAIDKPLAAARFEVIMPVLDTQQLLAMRTFMVDRIKDVGVQAAQKIKAEIGLAMIGTQDINQTVGKVAEILGDGSKSRAATIVGDNLTRAWAYASNERALQADEAGVKMKKTWRRSGKIHSRLAHDLADGTTKAIDQPFVINGHNVMYPKDPKAPLAEIINCGCVALYRPVEMKSTLADKRAFTARELELNPYKKQMASGKTLAEILASLK
ncbi:hypothetical protein [Quatrionicoccus australiensis]|uniref:hypothetical protein n=1 Tax=Quatrionicoccus australiensis TaxID=138118 RepID=UPI001CF91A72|nr:hypothetical protein [Quatrionicoccus australiensis]UCV13806.1 hypothetical protein KI612_12655 [Quatrionicoccus australiensis]